MATDEYLRWGWNQSEIFVLIEPAFTELLRDTDVLKVGYHVWARNGRHVSTISLHRFNNARPRPPPPVINITGPNRRLRIFMQLTWSPFIISRGHLFNIERREFCGFSRVVPLPRVQLFSQFFYLCATLSLFRLHFLPICPSVSICANLAQLLYFHAHFVRICSDISRVHMPLQRHRIEITRQNTISTFLNILILFTDHIFSFQWNSGNSANGSDSIQSCK